MTRTMKHLYFIKAVREAVEDKFGFPPKLCECCQKTHDALNKLVTEQTQKQVSLIGTDWENWNGELK